MNIPAIDPSLLVSPTSVSGGESVGGSFSAWLEQQLQATNTDVVSADTAVRQLAVGEPVNLHQVMVQLERAKLQFEMVMQVRNKLVSAYQEIMKTTV